MTEAPATQAAPEQAPAAAKPAAPPEQPKPTAPAADPAPKTDPPPAAADDAFKSEESKSAVLADLAKERTARQALEAKIEAQNKAMLAAFGVEEAPKGEDLAETVQKLQAQIAEDRHAALLDRLAAANGIDDDHKDLLTETDPEKLQAQAIKVGALIGAKKAADGTPAFQQNPGQGQGGQPPSPEVLEQQEYEKFYPPPSK